MTEKEIVWAKYFFDIIKVVKSKSKDPNTKVGCVIVGPDNQVISTGYNDFPFGVKNTKERWERPLKYSYVSHAERNAIYLAARSGHRTLGCTIYMEGIPCNDCTKAIIQSGIYRIIYNKEEWAKWNSPTYDKTHTDISLEMLTEAGIEVIGI